MGLGVAQMQTRAQRFDFEIRQRKRFAPGANDRQHTWNFQHAHPLITSDSYEDVAGKQRQLKLWVRAVSPAAPRPVKRQIRLDLPQFEILCDALLVPRRRIHGEPIWGRGLFGYHAVARVGIRGDGSEYAVAD